MKTRHFITDVLQDLIPHSHVLFKIIIEYYGLPYCLDTGDKDLLKERAIIELIDLISDPKFDGFLSLRSAPAFRPNLFELLYGPSNCQKSDINVLHELQVTIFNARNNDDIVARIKGQKPVNPKNMAFNLKEFLAHYPFPLKKKSYKENDKNYFRFQTILGMGVKALTLRELIHLFLLMCRDAIVTGKWLEDTEATTTIALFFLAIIAEIHRAIYFSYHSNKLMIDDRKNRNNKDILMALFVLIINLIPVEQWVGNTLTFEQKRNLLWFSNGYLIGDSLSFRITLPHFFSSEFLPDLIQEVRTLQRTNLSTFFEAASYLNIAGNFFTIYRHSFSPASVMMSLPFALTTLANLQQIKLSSYQTAKDIENNWNHHTSTGLRDSEGFTREHNDNYFADFGLGIVKAFFIAIITGMFTENYFLGLVAFIATLGEASKTNAVQYRHSRLFLKPSTQNMAFSERSDEITDELQEVKPSNTNTLMQTSSIGRRFYRGR